MFDPITKEVFETRSAKFDEGTWGAYLLNEGRNIEKVSLSYKPDPAEPGCRSEDSRTDDTVSLGELISGEEETGPEGEADEEKPTTHDLHMSGPERQQKRGRRKGETNQELQDRHQVRLIDSKLKGFEDPNACKKGTVPTYWWRAHNGQLPRTFHEAIHSHSTISLEIQEIRHHHRIFVWGLKSRNLHGATRRLYPRGK